MLRPACVADLKLLARARFGAETANVRFEYPAWVERLPRIGRVT